MWSEKQAEFAHMKYWKYNQAPNEAMRQTPALQKDFSIL